MMYEILSDNMPRLTKKLTAIQKKCNTYGCEFTYQELGETFKNVKDEETGFVRTAKFIQIQVSGTARVNDWEFIATIEHSKPINIIRSFRPEVEIPESYYTADTRCDHCNTKRNRKDTYLIRNTITGEFKQVGKTCLKDFTHGLSAEAVAAYVSWFDELIKGEQPTPGFKHYYSVAEVLQYAVEAVRLYGYTKTYSEGVSTQDIVREQMFQLRGWKDRVKEDGYDVDHRGNKEKVEQILTWVPSLADEFGYNTNLKAVCLKECCENRDFGLICSAVAVYNREMERKARQEFNRRADEKSVWVGAEGDRIELHDLHVRLLTSWDTQFGYTYLYKLTAPDGNIFTWKTGKWLGDSEEISNNTRVSLKGTVKGHNEYRGVMQTELTRCKIL